MELQLVLLNRVSVHGVCVWMQELSDSGQPLHREPGQGAWHGMLRDWLPSAVRTALRAGPMKVSVWAKVCPGPYLEPAGGDWDGGGTSAHS